MNIHSKGLSIILFSMLAILLLNPPPLFSQENSPKAHSTAALITGTIIGLGLSVYNGVLLFGYTPQVPIGEKLVAFTIPAAAGIGVSILTTQLFFDIFSSSQLNKWLSIPLGSVAGYIEGAIIGGVTYALFFSIMEAMDPEFSNAKSVLDAAWMGFAGGGIFGGLIGILPGCGAATLIRFSLAD